MSLDKGIRHGKEHRKPYYHAGRYDKTCRPHGGCPYCLRAKIWRWLKRLPPEDVDDNLEST